MGKMWKNWKMEELRRVMQYFSVPWTADMKKQQLAAKLAEHVNKTGRNSRSLREEILNGDVEYEFPFRYQEIDEKGEPRTSAYPKGGEPMFSKMDNLTDIVERFFGGNSLPDYISPGEEVKSCAKCHRQLSEHIFPHSISARCQHNMTWCRPCLAKDMHAQIEEANDLAINCPVCGVAMDANEVEPLIRPSVFSR